MLLRDLINPQHLSSNGVQKVRRALRDDMFAAVVVDDFLTAPFAASLLACFEEDGDFDMHHCLLEASSSGYREHVVTEAQFNRSPEPQRLARELMMNGPAPGREHSKGWRAHLQLMDLFSSSAFRVYLTAVSGLADPKVEFIGYMARTMRFSDVCHAHSDAGSGRTLCMLLYIGDDWQPGFGGRFQNLISGTAARSTDPLGNRVILHRPYTDQIHQVEQIGEAGRHWRRYSYSAWFGISPPC